jgi:Membrane proteins related to metalloendopeptidases
LCYETNSINKFNQQIQSTNSINKLWFGIFAISLLLGSCQQDPIPQPPPNSLEDARIMMAKLWYENWQQDKEIANVLGLETKAANKTKDTLLSSKVRGEPLWEMARVGVDEVVEVPLKLDQGMTFSNSKNPKEAELNASVTRLLILKDDQGFYYSVYMHIQADAEYLSACGYDLQKTAYKNVQPDFTGRVFYTSEEGGFINGWIYVNGHINGEIAKMRNIESRSAAQLKTKTVMACWSEYYDIYVRTCYYAINYCTEWAYVGELEVIMCGTSGGDGGTGGGGGSQPIPTYTVSLSVNPSGGGFVDGAGSYTSGASVTISAAPYSGYKFVNWTGSETVSTASYYFLISYNRNYIANFRPCYATNKANPLPNMALAPPPGSAVLAATYGKTRKNGTKDHNGIDLFGAVGTPIYAQFDGTISDTPITGQPNKINDDYPSSYSGDKNDAGNRIYVSSTIGGKNVKNGYMHLQAGTPLGTNPRTGQAWALNDNIYAGEIIGYIGITGNADPAMPHLHLQTYVNGTLANPDTYLNATISTTTTAITTPCD